jgi:hypothetical protein
MWKPAAALAALLVAFAGFAADAQAALRVAVSSPAAGASVSGSVAWTATAAGGAVSQVSFLVDGQSRWADPSAPYRFNGDSGTLDTRTLANGAHTLSVVATTAQGRSATSSIGVTVANTPVVAPPPPAPASGSRYVYCLGALTYGSGGWLWDATSTDWIRQYPTGHPERVSFDGSVPVMQSVGCQTVRAEIQPGDLSSNGGTDVQRAQLYASDAMLSKDPFLQPALGDQPGQTTWYGFAFSTNPGYQPEPAPVGGTGWNNVFSWHPGGNGPQGTEVQIWTESYASSDCLAPNQPFADGRPHVGVSLNGGDPAAYPNAGSTCLRFAGPAFVAGHVYRVEMGVTWGANDDGAFQVWIDGVKYADLSGVSTLWQGQTVYALFENYRHYTAALPTNDVYYGGLVKGASRADVIVP